MQNNNNCCLLFIVHCLLFIVFCLLFIVCCLIVCLFVCFLSISSCLEFVSLLQMFRYRIQSTSLLVSRKCGDKSIQLSTGCCNWSRYCSSVSVWSDLVASSCNDIGEKQKEKSFERFTASYYHKNYIDKPLSSCNPLRSISMFSGSNIRHYSAS